MGGCQEQVHLFGVCEILPGLLHHHPTPLEVLILRVLQELRVFVVDALTVIGNVDSGYYVV